MPARGARTADRPMIRKPARPAASLEAPRPDRPHPLGVLRRLGDVHTRRACDDSSDRRVAGTERRGLVDITDQEWGITGDDEGSDDESSAPSSEPDAPASD